LVAFAYLTGGDVQGEVMSLHWAGATCGVASALMGGVLCISDVLGKNLLAKIASTTSKRQTG